MWYKISKNQCLLFQKYVVFYSKGARFLENFVLGKTKGNVSSYISR